MTLRTRVTLAFAGVLALLLLLFSAVLYAGMAYALYAELDRSLAGRAAEVAHAVRVMPRQQWQPRLWVMPGMTVFATPDLFMQILDADGQPLLRSSNLQDEQLPAVLPESEADRYLTTQVGETRLRLYSLPVVRGDRTLLVVQTARPLRELDFTLWRLRWTLFSGSLLTLVLSAGLVAWLTRAFVAPLARITRTATQIEAAGDLQMRVDYAGPPDEIGQFAAAFNAMLTRLQGAYNRLSTAYQAQRRFLADISHQLRTPLTVIRGNADLLQRMQQTTDAVQTSEVQEVVADLSDAAAHLSRLVDHLLTLARAEAGQPLVKEPVALAEVLDEAARQGRRLTEGRRFEVAGLERAEGCTVLGQRDYLVQLLLILLENAGKYTPPGGRVQLQVTTDGAAAQITVADDGPGIDPRHLEQIFERFYRAPGATGTDGTGLGLAIGRWIAAEHGGRLTVRSAPGQGSRFTVHLPLVQDEKGA